MKFQRQAAMLWPRMCILHRAERRAGAARSASRVIPRHIRARAHQEPGGHSARPMGMKPHMLRVRTGARCLLVAAVCAAAATACGSKPAPSGATASGSTPAPAPKVSLDITVSTKPGVPPKHWTLRCDPAGGTHPDPAAACAVLLKAKNPFAPPPKGVMCPMIRVGTKTAIIKGTYFGKHIDMTLVQGGCQLAEWAKIGQIFN
jgi:hypothetical protein